MASITNSTAVVHEHSFYGYTPTGSICILFMVLFGISALLHIGEAVKWRTWYMLPTMGLGCVGEVIGWYGRYWSSTSPGELNAFLMNITTLIISPSFMSAANFTILGLIIKRLGPQYSWLTPRWYLIIFIGLDLGALVVQSIGGAKASSAAKNGTDAEAGGKIMLYGIIIQMIALSVYVILGTDFIVRYQLDKPVRKVVRTNDYSSESVNEKSTARPPLEKNLKIMLIGLVINVVFFFIRTIYRTIELNNGWSGEVISNQLLFNVLDGAAITLCTYTFNFIHPGYFLREKPVHRVSA